jgi:hypothetical protein
VNQVNAGGFSKGGDLGRKANLGEVCVDYSPQSYVGIRRSRRVWAPPWFRKDGATVHLPDPDGPAATSSHRP